MLPVLHGYAYRERMGDLRTVHAPNEETIAAIQAAERGELIRIGHPSNLIADLDAD